jgi:colanic acid biosynthesis glycosyl transferase WcaI
LKKVLLLSGNYSPEKTGIGRYNGEIMTWLSQNGFDCEVISTYPYYPQWEIDSQYSKKKYWYTIEKNDLVKVFRCPIYVPSNPSGLKRILLDLSFSFTASFVILKKLFTTKIDYIIVVAPPFQLGLLAVFYKIFRNTRFIYHTQDMQIEAARDLGMIKSQILIKILFKIEKLIFRKADVLTSISSGMIKKIEDKAKKEVVFFPNWADLNIVYPIDNKESLKLKFGFKADDKIILYSGAIGEKQGLDVILKIAKRYLNQQRVRFVICGSGPYKEKLEQIANNEQLYNIFFMPLQAKELFNDFLNAADIHLVIQKSDASDLVMPSKITNILAAGGLSITTANIGTNLYTEIINNEMGIVVPSENEEALAIAIEKSLTMDSKIKKINARKYAEINLNIDNVLKRFVSDTLN